MSSTDPNVRKLAYNGRSYFTDTNTLDIQEREQILDELWARRAFLVNDADLEKVVDAQQKYYSTAEVKFTDTRLGMSIGINARPQFTPYSDIRVKGKVRNRNDVTLGFVGGNYGLGRYYSEAIDDNAQTIYMRFGVPQFNSLMVFFQKAFNPATVRLVRSGRAESVWYSAARAVGSVGIALKFPMVALAFLTVKLLAVCFSAPSSKFYTMKPTMHLYWKTVNSLVNAIAINRGILPRFYRGVFGEPVVDEQSPYYVDGDYLAKLHDLMPDVFTSNFGYDIWAVANRAQRIANRIHEHDFDKWDNPSADPKVLLEETFDYDQYDDRPDANQDDIYAYYQEYITADTYQLANEEAGDMATENPRLEPDPRYDQETGEQLKDPPAGLYEHLNAELRSGSGFAIFKVDFTGPINESFSNSVMESDLSNKFNSISSQFREARFSFAGGNVTGTPVDGIVAGAVDAATGFISGITFGMFDAIAGLAGGGYIDIPKHWQSSNVSMPKASYSMQLVSPYGNPISQMQNIFIPLAMLMAGALPRSVGKQSYTSPFLVQVFDQGRCQIRLGMIESLSITRGTSHMAFSPMGKVMAVDVSFTVADLSSIMHMPISTGKLFDTPATMDEDNVLMDYLAVLAGQDMYSQIYPVPKAKLNLARLVSSKAHLISPAYWSSFVADQTPVSAIRWLFPKSDLLPRPSQ